MKFTRKIGLSLSLGLMFCVPAFGVSLHDLDVSKGVDELIIDVQKQLSSGALVNELDANGATFLDKAIVSGLLEVVRMLLDADANINGVNSQKFSPLVLAVYVAATAQKVDRGLLQIFQLLQGALTMYEQADKETQDRSKSSFVGMLNAAALLLPEKNYYPADPEHYDAIVKLLLERGANQYVSTKETPLHLAVMKNKPHLVRLLLPTADLTFKVGNDELGFATPLELAEAHGYSEIAQMLRDAGAKE